MYSNRPQQLHIYLLPSLFIIFDVFVFVPGVHGEHSESADGTFDISNRDRYGLSEFAAISTMAKGVKNLVRIENALMEYKKKLDELEGKK